MPEGLHQPEDLFHWPADVTLVDHHVPHSPCPVDDKGGPGWSPAVPGHAHAHHGEGEVCQDGEARWTTKPSTRYILADPPLNC